MFQNQCTGRPLDDLRQPIERWGFSSSWLHVTPGLRPTMLSSAIRSSLRSSSRLTARSATPNRVSAFRSSGFRKYSTEAPKSSSNTLLWAGLGTAVVGGVAWYFYSSDDAVKGAETALKSGVHSAKVAAKFVPTKEDYQKVRCRKLALITWRTAVDVNICRSTTGLPRSWTMLAMRGTTTVPTVH